MDDIRHTQDRDEIERRDQGPQDAPRRGDGVQPPCRGSHRGHRPRLQPHGEGRDRTQKHAGHQEQDEAGDQGAQSRSHVARGDGAIQVGIDEWQEGDDHAGDADERSQDGEARPAVRGDPAQPVAQTQGGQHHADEAPPHEDGVAEVGSQHAASDDLEGHQDRPAHEDHHVEQPGVPRGGPVRRPLRLLVLPGVESALCHGVWSLSSVRCEAIRMGPEDRRGTGIPDTDGPNPWPGRLCRRSGRPDSGARLLVGRPGDHRSSPTGSRPRP